jgi:hypothetical protein
MKSFLFGFASIAMMALSQTASAQVAVSNIQGSLISTDSDPGYAYSVEFDITQTLVIEEGGFPGSGQVLMTIPKYANGDDANFIFNIYCSSFMADPTDGGVVTAAYGMMDESTPDMWGTINWVSLNVYAFEDGRDLFGTFTWAADVDPVNNPCQGSWGTSEWFSLQPFEGEGIVDFTPP